MKTLSVCIKSVELEINYNFTPGRPAKLWDIPENCYPEEYPEIEIESIICGEEDIIDVISKDIINLIEEKILEEENKEQDDGY